MHFHCGSAFGMELFLEDFISAPGVNCLPAGEKIDRGIAVLGPGVDGQVAFLYGQHPGDTVWREAVEI